MAFDRPQWNEGEKSDETLEITYDQLYKEKLNRGKEKGVPSFLDWITMKVLWN